MGASDRLNARFRKTEVLYFSLSYQFLHGTGHVLHWDGGVHAVLVEQVNAVSSQSLERSVGDFFDVLGTAIEANRIAGGRINLPPELGRDDHPIPDGLQRLPDKFLVCERSVDLSGV